MKMTTSTVADRVAETKIESIRMVTRLKITIWTRVLAPEREVKHEEGHRVISESYYGRPENGCRPENGSVPKTGQTLMSVVGR